MIIGECPYKDCKGVYRVPPGPVPCWSLETCKDCGRQYFLKHARIGPEAFTKKQVMAMGFDEMWEAW